MPYVLALVPTIGMATLFYFVIKSILEGDRRERIAHAKWEKEHQAGDNGTQSAPAPTSDDNTGTSTPRHHRPLSSSHSKNTSVDSAECDYLRHGSVN